MDSLIDKYLPDLVDASESESRRRELARGWIYGPNECWSASSVTRCRIRQALATHGCSLAGDPCPTGVVNSPLPMRRVITSRSRPPTAQSSLMHCWPLPYTMSIGSMYRSSQVNSRLRTIRCGPESDRRMRRTLIAGRPRARPPCSRNEERATRGWGRRSRSFSDRRRRRRRKLLPCRHFVTGTAGIEPATCCLQKSPRGLRKPNCLAGALSPTRSGFRAPRNRDDLYRPSNRLTLKSVPRSDAIKAVDLRRRTARRWQPPAPLPPHPPITAALHAAAGAGWTGTQPGL